MRAVKGRSAGADCRYGRLHAAPPFSPHDEHEPTAVPEAATAFAARRLLLSQDADASTAAISVGYESVSQFHREYKRQFGITPIGDKALSLAAGTGRPY